MLICFINKALLAQSQPVYPATVSQSFPATAAELGVVTKAARQKVLSVSLRMTRQHLALDPGLEERVEEMECGNGKSA
jgi:hypothetical protein